MKKILDLLAHYETAYTNVTLSLSHDGSGSINEYDEHGEELTTILRWDNANQMEDIINLWHKTYFGS